MSSFRTLLRAWLGCILLPLPVIVFWRSNYGRGIALGLFFMACAILVSFAFEPRDDTKQPEETIESQHAWRRRMLTLGVCLLTAWGIFSGLILTLSNERDFVAAALAFGSLFPALCVTPYFMMLTRNTVAAVVFTMFLEFAMKLLGCIVVVLVYGWDASERGYTTMPWTHPNLLVWCFWLNTAALSLCFYFLGGKQFRKQVPAEPDGQPNSTAVSPPHSSR